MKALTVSGALLGLVLCATGPAKSATVDYNFSFTGTAFSGSGEIAINSALDSLGGHDITSISGSISGPTAGAITGLDTQPGTPNATGLYTDPVTGNSWYYNDVLFTSGVPFDNNGVLFSFGSDFVANLYSVGSQLYLSVSQPGAYFNPGDEIVQMNVSATPIPGALPLFATGMVLLGLLGWHRQRKTAAVAA